MSCGHMTFVQPGRRSLSLLFTPTHCEDKVKEMCIYYESLHGAETAASHAVTVSSKTGCSDGSLSRV